MKIIELFNRPMNEGIADIAKSVATGANEFVAGAGGPDIIQSVKKYIKTPTGTTRSISADLPPQEQFDRILVAIYGNKGKSEQLRQDWADAINAGSADAVKKVGQNATYRAFRRPEGLDGDKLKQSHSTVIDDLIRMASSGNITFSVQPEEKKEPDPETGDETL